MCGSAQEYHSNALRRKVKGKSWLINQMAKSVTSRLRGQSGVSQVNNKRRGKQKRSVNNGVKSFYDEGKGRPSLNAPHHRNHGTPTKTWKRGITDDNPGMKRQKQS